jgi:hypothetical protein
MLFNLPEELTCIILFSGNICLMDLVMDRLSKDTKISITKDYSIFCIFSGNVDRC